MNEGACAAGYRALEADACAEGVILRSRPASAEPRQRSQEPASRDSACVVVAGEAVTVAAMEPAEPPNELVSAEGRNRKAVLCQRCGSRVLQPGTALFSRRQGLANLPRLALNLGPSCLNLPNRWDYSFSFPP
ncbi:guanine nucleotide exchange factor MSS4 isoform X2 [Sciurus carolinensis]|uniref:guanine nucleotide exchange factor MSS4 isoform X2 n=1 Tax=Sciurus carolinensis TaxID=30640 RepID=UPI001FB3FC4F|nr:guanine nucleotide exchange factor MSS4 isoform X2 [Sciurus carolinensis]